MSPVASSRCVPSAFGQVSPSRIRCTIVRYSIDYWNLSEGPTGPNCGVSRPRAPWLLRATARRQRIMPRSTGGKMNLELNEDQRMIKAAAREFAQNEIAPIAARFDTSGEFPAETIRKAGELGFMGVEIPEEYGGAGFDAISYALVISEISAADAAHGTIVSVNNSLYGTSLLDFGTEEQKRELLEPVASGRVNAAYALTEPQSGSDAASMRSRATLSPDGSFYTINARKSWIT